MIQEGLGLNDQVYSHFLKEWLKKVLGATLTGACPWHSLRSLNFEHQTREDKATTKPGCNMQNGECLQGAIPGPGPVLLCPKCLLPSGP